MKKKFDVVIFYIALMMFSFGYSLTLNRPDYDLWARLLQGKAFWDLGHILKNDPFSFTFTHLWYDHEWGASVIFYFVYDHFGVWGLVFLKTLLIFLILYLISRIVKLFKPINSKYYNFLYYYFAVIAMGYVLVPTIRCHLFTFVLFTLFIFILEKVRKENKNKLLFLIPIIMLFWSNTHGGCVSGIGLLVMYAFGEFLNKKPFKKYIYTLIPTCLVTFINPYGIEYVKFLIKATTMPRPYISEWRNSFTEPFVRRWIKYKIYFLVFLISSIVSLVKNFKSKQKIDYTKYIILTVTAYLSIKHVKHQPFFVISCAAFLYDEFYYLVNKLMEKIRLLFKINSKTLINNFVVIKEAIIYFIIFMYVITVVHIASPNPNIGKIKYPYYHVEFLRINDMKGTLLANFHYGSYISYKLFPYNLIYMDGRYEEVYYEKSLILLRDFYRGGKNWDKILELDIDYIINENDKPNYKLLKNHKDYKLVSEYKTFGLFVKKSLLKDKYKLPPKDIEYYINHQFKSPVNYFHKIIINGKIIEFK